jgi:hypothetical protein
VLASALLLIFATDTAHRIVQITCYGNDCFRRMHELCRQYTTQPQCAVVVVVLLLVLLMLLDLCCCS